MIRAITHGAVLAMMLSACSPDAATAPAPTGQTAEGDQLALSTDRGVVTLLSERVLDSGAILGTWDVEGDEVTVRSTGRASVHVTHRDNPSGIVVEVTPESSSQARFEARSAASRRAAVKDVALDAASLGPGLVVGSWCADISALSGRARAHICEVQYDMGADSSGKRYYSDSVTGSGHVTDWWYGLRKLVGRVTYSDGNEIVSWAPAGTISPSSCRPMTLSVAVFGAAVSGSTPMACPDVLTPMVSPPYRSMGVTYLSNLGSTDTVGVVSVDIDRNSSGSHTPLLGAEIQWS